MTVVQAAPLFAPFQQERVLQGTVPFLMKMVQSVVLRILAHCQASIAMGHRLALNIAECVEALHGCAGGAVRISPVLLGATGMGRAAYSHTGHMYTQVLWRKGTT